MRKKTNFRELSLLLQDIEQQSNAHPTFTLFHRDKIKEFYESNRGRIDELGERTQGVLKQYAKLDERGMPLIIQTPQGPQIQFKSDEDLKEYQKFYYELLKEEIYLSL